MARPDSRRTWTDAERALVADLVAAKASMQEIADAVGRPFLSVRNFVEKNGGLRGFRLRTGNGCEKRRKQQRQRPCMCCREMFASEGIHNRLCSTCRSRTAPGYRSDGYRCWS